MSGYESNLGVRLLYQYRHLFDWSCYWRAEYGYHLSARTSEGYTCQIWANEGRLLPLHLNIDFGTGLKRGVRITDRDEFLRLVAERGGTREDKDRAMVCCLLQIINRRGGLMAASRRFYREGDEFFGCHPVAAASLMRQKRRFRGSGYIVGGK